MSGAADGAPRRALVVDDEPGVLQTTARILRRLGFAVTCAATGAEGIAVVTAEGAALALVVTDLAMPDLDGLAVSRAIHALWPALPIILVTGYGETPRADGVFAASLSKPFTVEELGALVRELIPGVRERG